MCRAYAIDCRTLIEQMYRSYVSTFNDSLDPTIEIGVRAAGLAGQTVINLDILGFKCHS